MRKNIVRQEVATTSNRVTLDLDRHVPYFFTYISNKLSRGASDTYRKHFGLGITEWRVMGVLAGMPDISANQIISAIGLDKGAVSRGLHVLEQERLVTSEPDPKDNRSRIMRLSKSGNALHDRIIVAALAREKRLLSTLSPEEVEILIVCLRKLRANVPYVNAYDPLDPAPGKRRK
ncbi:MAG TPA: MarR family winged helix-turn-helix transcriptional regulator [Sphingobium sp.]|uniref:MarR family winged helix-turn-helix transcriptional regulator n=1 Tax=Sphingobium sp. TaxID=1912891 RepID=UPI002ED0E8C9